MMANSQTNATDDWVELRPVTPARLTPPPKNFKIPLIIHQSHAFNKLPRPLAECVQSWIDLNPEFEHRYYDDQAMADYVHAHAPPEYIRAFDFVAAIHPRASGAIQADLFRLLVLSREGGVWSDADRRARNPIMKILTPDDQYICGIRNDKRELIPSFEVMLAAPGHPFITAAIENIIAAKIYQKRLRLRRLLNLSHDYTGPIPFRRVALSLTPSPHPLGAGVRAISQHPDFTYTVIAADGLDGAADPFSFLMENMNSLHQAALKAMGLTPYAHDGTLWSRREDLFHRVAYLIANPRQFPGVALRRIKRAANKFAR